MNTIHLILFSIGMVVSISAILYMLGITIKDYLEYRRWKKTRRP